MKRILIEQLEPGMKLARPLMRGDMVLLGEGTELVSRHIEKIREMEVAHVFVEGSSPPEISRAELLAQLDARFKHVDALPYMDLIKDVIRKHIEELYA
jgi:hypothetical protein